MTVSQTHAQPNRNSPSRCAPKARGVSSLLCKESCMDELAKAISDFPYGILPNVTLVSLVYERDLAHLSCGNVAKFDAGPHTGGEITQSFRI